MHITRRPHIVQNILLQLRDRLQRIWHVLVLLYAPDDLGCFGSLGEINEARLLNQRWDAVLDEGKIGEVDACFVPLVRTLLVLPVKLTEKRYAWRIRFRKRIPVLGKVLSAAHQLSH